MHGKRIRKYLRVYCRVLEHIWFGGRQEQSICRRRILSDTVSLYGTLFARKESDKKGFRTIRKKEECCELIPDN